MAALGGAMFIKCTPINATVHYAPCNERMSSRVQEKCIGCLQAHFSVQSKANLICVPYFESYLMSARRRIITGVFCNLKKRDMGRCKVSKRGFLALRSKCMTPKLIYDFLVSEDVNVML